MTFGNPAVNRLAWPVWDHVCDRTCMDPRHVYWSEKVAVDVIVLIIHIVIPLAAAAQCERAKIAVREE